MTNLEILHATIDGRIPAALIRRASDLDAGERLIRDRARHCRIGRVRWKPESLPRRIADAMVRLRENGRDCTFHALLAEGFDHADLRRWAGHARALAASTWLEKHNERDAA